MKFRLVSDLHLDFSKYELPFVEGEQDMVLLLAGDVAEIKRKNAYLDFFEDVCFRFKTVIYVFGNHEFYGDSYLRAHDHFTRNFQSDNLYVLDNDKIELNNIVILGTTLWTDMHRNDPLIVHDSKYYMSDYSVIRMGGFNNPYQRTLNPSDTIYDNAVAKKFIFDECKKANNEGKKSVVITHHAPSWASVAPFYKNDPMSFNYANSYDNYLAYDEGPNLWAHGHIHTACSYDAGKTKVICNPRGYHAEKFGHEETNFNETLVIDLNEETGVVSIV